MSKHLHLDALDLKAVPFGDSFCRFVLRDTLFVTTESGSDPRLGGPYSDFVQSYVGVPLSDGQTLRGNLCHLDTESHPVTDDEFLLLARIARLVPSYLGREGQPMPDFGQVHPYWSFKAACQSLRASPLGSPQQGRQRS